MKGPSRTDRRSLYAMIVVGCLSGRADARNSAHVGPTMPLEAMSFQDAEKAGAVGTGCTWRGGPKLAGRMFMADDRAAVKREGKMITMKPAKDAKPLFLTYDRWTNGVMDIRIYDTGMVVARSGESSETLARLDLRTGRRTRSFSGRLNCGS